VKSALPSTSSAKTLPGAPCLAFETWIVTP
jgi:hypothetical protein